MDDILGEESDNESEEKGKEERMEQEKEAVEQPQNCKHSDSPTDCQQDLGRLADDTTVRASSSLSESIPRYRTCSDAVEVMKIVFVSNKLAIYFD